jgi:hypothetical protein
MWMADAGRARFRPAVPGSAIPVRSSLPGVPAARGATYEERLI